MYDSLIAPFSENAFMVNALIAGILVAIACSVVGTFIVLRGLAFIGDALAHGVLPGIAAAILLGYPSVLGAAVGAAAMVGGVTLITRKSRLSSDTAIGLLFVGMLALGVVIVSKSDKFSGDLIRILFGEILGISSSAIVLQAGVTVAVLITAFICARPFMLICFDEEQAQVSGFSPGLFHIVMLIMIAATVVASFQTVGTLLVFGMLLAPSSAGVLLAGRVTSMLWAAAIGISSVYIGLLISYHYDTAAGPTVVLIATVVLLRRVHHPVVSTAIFRKGCGDDKMTSGPPQAQAPTLSATDLSVGFGSTVIVEGISVALYPGEALALLGTNGSGKSTFLKTIVGLLPPMGGSITVCDETPGSAPKRVAYMSQYHKSAHILPLQVREVVMMGRYAQRGLLGRLTAEDSEIVDAAIEAMRIGDIAKMPVRELSGGQQQRTYLAQLIAHRADFWAVDEPTASLDANAEEIFMEAMQRERTRGVAVVIATHDFEEASHCDKAMLLARRVVAYGTPSEVLTDSTLSLAFGPAHHPLGEEE